MSFLSPDTQIKLKDLIENTLLPIGTIGQELGLSHSTTHRWVTHNYGLVFRKQRSSKCYSERAKRDHFFVGMTGARHLKYKEKTITKDGYVLVLKPDWYTARKSQYRAYEHHIVYCLANGIKEIPKGYCVHHVDFNKLNNSIDNLLMLTHSAHGKLHRDIQLNAG